MLLLPFLFLLYTTVTDAYTFDPNEILCLVNLQRSLAGLRPLGHSSRLSQAAQVHSDDQAQTMHMSHTGSDGSTPGDRVSEAGFVWMEVGENVAYGYDSIVEVMDTWMQSSGHRANILGEQYEMFGAGVSVGRDGLLYWTQEFGTDAYGVRNIPQCSSDGRLLRGFSAPSSAPSPPPSRPPPSSSRPPPPSSSPPPPSEAAPTPSVTSVVSTPVHAPIIPPPPPSSSNGAPNREPSNGEHESHRVESILIGPVNPGQPTFAGGAETVPTILPGNSGDIPTPPPPAAVPTPPPVAPPALGPVTNPRFGAGMFTLGSV